MPTFCQHSQHRTLGCAIKDLWGLWANRSAATSYPLYPKNMPTQGVGGQKKTKFCQRSLLTTPYVINDTLLV